MQLLHILLFVTTTLAVAAVHAQFTSFNGLLCMKSAFVETHNETPSRLCAFLCSNKQNCQAFTTVDGPCQLFVFDKCSKYVRDCNCTRRGEVFVKQQTGLPSGTLCPTNYTDNFCGTKYKAYKGITNWNTIKATVESEPGLVIMADITDSSEFTFVKSLFTKYSMTTVFLGGHQLPGSVEPAGGWQWASCNTSISSSLWNSEEPNNGGGVENVIVATSTFAGLTDGGVSYHLMSGGFGECVSPFE